VNIFSEGLERGDTTTPQFERSDWYGFDGTPNNIFYCCFLIIFFKSDPSLKVHPRKKKVPVKGEK